MTRTYRLEPMTVHDRPLVFAWDREAGAQAVDFDAVDQAADGKRRLPVVQLGQLGRMQEQAMINQQAQDQASA